jgi:hypothetical protein
MNNQDQDLEDEQSQRDHVRDGIGIATVCERVCSVAGTYNPLCTFCRPRFYRND